MEAPEKIEPAWRNCELKGCENLFDTNTDPTDPKSNWKVLVGLEGNRRHPFKAKKFTQEEMNEALNTDDVYCFCKECYFILTAEIVGNKFSTKDVLNSMVKTPHGNKRIKE